MKENINLLIQANKARAENRYEDAIELYRKYLDRTDNVNAMYILAWVYFNLDLANTRRNDRGSMSIEWIDKAITQEPNIAEFYVMRGDIFNFGKDAPNYEEAAKNYRQAILLNPDLYSGYLGLASLHSVPEQVVSLSEAVLCMEKAAELQPENSTIFLSLGSLYMLLGQEDQALEAYEYALLRPQPLLLKNVVEIIQQLR